jgi:hypothetical protein
MSGGGSLGGMPGSADTRQVELVLDGFAREALGGQVARAGVSEARLIQQAVRHWLEVRGSQRLSVRAPRFGQSGSVTATRVRVRVRLAGSEWEALERSAADQGVTLERLLVHVVMLFLADLDSGRLAVRVARGENQ